MTADETGRELLGMMEWGGKSIDKAFLISGHYATVLNNKCAGADWWQTLSALRDTEERARNLAAHTMTRVDEDWLKEKGDHEAVKGRGGKAEQREPSPGHKDSSQLELLRRDERKNQGRAGGVIRCRKKFV